MRSRIGRVAAIATLATVIGASATLAAYPAGYGAYHDPTETRAALRAAAEASPTQNAEGGGFYPPGSRIAALVGNDPDALLWFIDQADSLEDLVGPSSGQTASR